jgi:hypothetical protein
MSLNLSRKRDCPKLLFANEVKSETFLEDEKNLDLYKELPLTLSILSIILSFIF